MNAARATARKHLARRRHPRGQAMAEYSILNAVFLVGSLGVLLLVKFKVGDHPPVSLVEAFFLGYRIYVDSLALILSLPFP
jgi:hypothetical protein